MRTFGISSFASLFGADVYSVHVSPLVVDGSKQCCDATIDFHHCLCWVSFLPCVFYPCPILFFFFMIPSLPALFLLSCHHQHYSLGYELVTIYWPRRWVKWRRPTIAVLC